MDSSKLKLIIAALSLLLGKTGRTIGKSLGLISEVLETSEELHSAEPGKLTTIEIDEPIAFKTKSGKKVYVRSINVEVAAKE